MEISTARFANTNLKNMPGAKLAITLKPPWFPLPYELAGNWKELAPDSTMFALRAGNSKAREEYEAAYRKRLNSLGLVAIDKFLQGVLDSTQSQRLILLCYEDLRVPDAWCHRRMFAQWYEERTGKKILELEEPLLKAKGRKPQEKVAIQDELPL